MIVTITLNASIDKRYVVNNALQGEVNRVSECSYTPGGKGLNVSKPLTILGTDVIATGFVGGYAGKYIENGIEMLGIKSAMYHLKEESRSCINIWDEDKKVHTEYLEPGFTVSEEDQEAFIREFGKIITDAEVVTISGSVPKGIDTTYYQKLIKIAKGKGKKVILDTSGELLSEGLKTLPTMIKPNIDEIRMLTGKKCENLEDIMQAAKLLHETGIENVVVSLGSAGSIMACDEGIYRAVVPKINAVNTVGCGDSMTAGFAKAFEDKTTMVEALRLASAVSAASAMLEETGFFNIEDMKELLDKISIDKIEL
ncbi:MAG: 1-phosphofructokinase [Suipraeoptans sp.]